MNYTPNEPPRAMSAAEIEEILPHLSLIHISEPTRH